MGVLRHLVPTIMRPARPAHKPVGAVDYNRSTDRGDRRRLLCEKHPTHQEQNGAPRYMSTHHRLLMKDGRLVIIN
jgi:hypothetical protein